MKNLIEKHWVLVSFILDRIIFDISFYVTYNYTNLK